MKYVAFLRGINVGGSKNIKMDALRKMFESLEFTGVKSYINSGNLIFETEKSDVADLVAGIENAIEDRFSLSVDVMIRSIGELVKIVENNPFEGKFDDPRQMHVLFLKDRLSPEKSGLLTAQNSDSEMFSVRGREIYCLLPNGLASSILGKDFISKKLKVSATARNWRTVNKVLEL
ncbi:MAG: DUF1697 domain-containing protein [Pyrinomonadaceae bacterium]|nr:DUF1697 domain-containing protein [Pyrinomonadaceae bacterium]